jgi:uncharacterized protein YidB (DUF937 family)
MSNLEDAVNEAVPNNDYVKPLMIAAGALLLGHLFGGNKQEAPANPYVPPQSPQPPQNEGGGFLGGIGSALGGIFGGGSPQAGGASSQAGGGLGGILGGLANSPLGGVIAGGAAGTAVSAGLDSLLNQFRGAGHAETVNSWVGNGANQPISPDQINNVLGQGKIAEIARSAGISPEQMSQLLAQALPALVDKLTPGGRLPQG